MARNGLDAVIVAICVFSKWVEAKPIQLNSLNAAKFLHEEIVCRYGMPTAIRTDQCCTGRVSLAVGPLALNRHSLAFGPFST